MYSAKNLVHVYALWSYFLTDCRVCEGAVVVCVRNKGIRDVICCKWNWNVSSVGDVSFHFFECRLEHNYAHCVCPVQQAATTKGHRIQAEIF